MKFIAAVVACLPALSSAHTIAQRIRVNGQDQGLSQGVRVATSNNPIYNVNDGNLACKSGFQSPVSSKVINVKAGDRVGMNWGHIIGGAQSNPDVDNPIAPSHKGPTLFYMAKVGNAATTGTTGLQWFKVFQDGLDGGGKWGVDRMYSAGGWVDFTMPSCIAPGQYLLRAEIIALHSAGSLLGVQFYMGCAQINVSSSGSKTGTTVSFPGAYKQNDAGILIGIYDGNGQPTNGGKPYSIPGPAVMTC